MAFAGVAAVGCSDSDSDGGAATAVPSTAGASEATSAPSDVDTADASATTTTTTTTATTTTTTLDETATIATVPEQGVPGIESEDPFCRAWSEFAGSFQALAFASAVATDALAAARLEVVAAGAVSAAVQTLADEFPDAIVSERDVFVDDIVGPFARRAGRASDELLAAGLSGEQVEQLGRAWLAALVDAGVDDPDVVVAVADDVMDPVAEATAAFAADVPSIAADPSLVTAAEAPGTFDHIARNCPDQGILAGNDAVG